MCTVSLNTCHAKLLLAKLVIKNLPPEVGETTLWTPVVVIFPQLVGEASTVAVDISLCFTLVAIQEIRDDSDL